jgi:hypothetical protein
MCMTRWCSNYEIQAAESIRVGYAITGSRFLYGGGFIDGIALSMNEDTAQRLTALESNTSPEPESPHNRMAKNVKAVVFVVGLIAVIPIVGAIAAMPAWPEDFTLMAALFVATATIPQVWIEGFAILAEGVTPDLRERAEPTRWFRNIGAYVGLVERPLLLGAIVAGHPQFVAVWLVFKGVAGYPLGLSGEVLEQRRLFSLNLLNNAGSLAGVAIGWALWTWLGMPTAGK